VGVQSGVGVGVKERGEQYIRVGYIYLRVSLGDLVRYCGVLLRFFEFSGVGCAG